MSLFFLQQENGLVAVHVPLGTKSKAPPTSQAWVSKAAPPAAPAAAGAWAPGLPLLPAHDTQLARLGGPFHMQSQGMTLVTTWWKVHLLRQHLRSARSQSFRPCLRNSFLCTTIPRRPLRMSWRVASVRQGVHDLSRS